MARKPCPVCGYMWTDDEPLMTPAHERHIAERREVPPKDDGARRNRPPGEG